MVSELKLGQDERIWERGLLAVAAVVLLATHFCVVGAFNVPAHSGGDQNGYLVGGKVLAHRGIGGMSVIDADTQQIDPYQFVGRIWIGADIGTPQERYYPKYPPGLPLFVAIGWWLGMGTTFAFWINPVLMMLGLGATFLVARLVAGSGPALLVTAVVATSPTVMWLTSDPNSHAGAMCFVTWGMYLVLQWSHAGDRGGLGRAIGAGLCLGMAVTFRYTEALMVLPAAVTALMTAWPRRSLRSWLQVGAMGGAWLAVVGTMLTYNVLAFGSLTGYDPTHESTGFRWEYFLDNWSNMLHALNDGGLFMLFPLAMAGMVGLLAGRWRVGLVMAVWIMPSMLLYTAYYWPANPEGWGYTRFYLTQYPALAACAAAVIGVCLVQPISSDGTAAIKPYRMAWLVGGGAVAALAILSNLALAMPKQKLGQLKKLHLQDQGRLILQHAPPGSLIFSDEQTTLHYLQYIGDYRLYETQPFQGNFLRRMEALEADDPHPFQPQRREALQQRFQNASDAVLGQVQQKLIRDAVARGRRVFVVQPWRPLRGKDQSQFGLSQMLPPRDYDTALVVTWDRMAVGDFVPKPSLRRSQTQEDFPRNLCRGMLVEVFPRHMPSLPDSKTHPIEAGELPPMSDDQL